MKSHPANNVKPVTKTRILRELRKIILARIDSIAPFSTETSTAINNGTFDVIKGEINPADFDKEDRYILREIECLRAAYFFIASLPAFAFDFYNQQKRKNADHNVSDWWKQSRYSRN